MSDTQDIENVLGEVDQALGLAPANATGVFGAEASPPLPIYETDDEAFAASTGGDPAHRMPASVPDASPLPVSLPACQI